MYEYRAKLIKVIDGDTVDAMVDCGFSMFRAERIRLRGINAPEVRTRNKEEKKKGLAAKARLQELIEENKNDEFMLQTFFDKKGKYGRVLGVLYTPIEGPKKMFGLTDFSHSLAYDWCPETEYLKYSYNGKLVEEGHAVEYKGKT
jgi:endonuclease YncB( thermonuclease family)|tara:strand:+ start:395 stop:829 length:435 start_codon:yes stop_codon:yes gene_type:complete